MKTSLLISYLKIALRNFSKYKGYTSITVFGLILGLTSFLLIILFVLYEFSYDKFFPEYERVARVIVHSERFGTEQVLTSAPLATKLKTDVAGIEYATSIKRIEAIIQNDSEQGSTEQGLYALEGFFEIFDMIWLQGKPEGILNDPDAIIITKTLSKKLFGNDIAINNTIKFRIEGNRAVTKTVKGVVENLPFNTHLKAFDFVIPLTSSSQYHRNLNNWSNRSFNTYIRLNKNVDVSSFEASLGELSGFIAQEDSYYRDRPSVVPSYKLQPLSRTHLYSGHLQFLDDKPGSITIVYMMSGIGLVILLLSIVNYVNLSTARYSIRAKEIGIRKALGSRRNQLVTQFLSEVFVQTLVALIASLCLVNLLIPYFGSLVGREITSDYLLMPSFLIGAAVSMLFTSVFAGGYPAFYLSLLEPVNALKGKTEKSFSLSRLRNFLVFGQFVVTISLITCTIVIIKQLNFIQSQDTGINRTNIVAIEINDHSLVQNYQMIEQEFSKIATLSDLSASNRLLIDMGGNTHVSVGTNQQNPPTLYSITPVFVSGSILKTFGLGLIYGSGFENEPPQVNVALINRSALKSFSRQPEEIVGNSVTMWDEEYKITGIVEDFQYSTSYNPIGPVILVRNPGEANYVYARFHPQNVTDALKNLETIYQGLAPGFPFQYHHLEDYYRNLYEKESKLRTAIGSGSMIALALSCLGILGLVLFTLSQRFKEIAIRKVLGASILNILKVFNLGYIKIMLLSFIVSIPITMFILNQWLSQFTYRVEIGIGSVVIGGLSVMACALVTVSWQTIRIAFANPIKSLRSE